MNYLTNGSSPIGFYILRNGISYCSTDTLTRAKSKVRSTVTVSWPGTLNARGEDVRHCDSFGMMVQTSVKQESNNYLGLDVQDCIGFEQR